MPQNNPAVLEVLARYQAAERRQGVHTRARNRRERRRRVPIEAAAHRTGWLLVDIGLRLAVSRERDHLSRARAAMMASDRGRSA
jgi:hypothetical protein